MVAMQYWHKTPEEWYELPRDGRIQLRAQYEGKLILDGLREYDKNEDARKEAERKRKGRR